MKFSATRRSASILTPILAAALLTVSIGCGGDESAPTPAAPLAKSAQPDMPKPTPTKRPAAQPQVSPAQELRRDLKLPDYYPDDAPRYPGSTASNFALAPDGKVNTLFGSEDTVEEITAHLADSLPSQGWEDFVTMPAPDGSLIEASKGKRKLTVMVRRIASGSADEVSMIAVLVDP